MSTLEWEAERSSPQESLSERGAQVVVGAEKGASPKSPVKQGVRWETLVELGLELEHRGMMSLPRGGRRTCGGCCKGS